MYNYKKYEPVFGAWYFGRLLGEGSFGRVYEIERNEFNNIYKAALKIITIPQSQSEIKSVMADGMDEKSVTEYFKNIVKEIANELVLMSKLKGNSNVVSYEDHIVVEHKEGIGWDILIRMELLTGLIDYINSTPLTRKDVIKLGIDICKALELCQKYNIIHRDIKLENIFISPNGDFKLGDFGIARQIEKTTTGLSKKGTYTYMAPEIYKGEAYGSTVDIYSLGIVLFRLLNENRTPFLPAYPSPITHEDRENALIKRISGEHIPLPINADGRLGEIILKACSYNPKDRYSSPKLMKDELEAILYNKEEAMVIYPKGDDVDIKSIAYVQNIQVESNNNFIKGKESNRISVPQRTEKVEIDSTIGKKLGLNEVSNTYEKTASLFGNAVSSELLKNEGQEIRRESEVKESIAEKIRENNEEPNENRINSNKGNNQFGYTANESSKMLSTKNTKLSAKKNIILISVIIIVFLGGITLGIIYMNANGHKSLEANKNEVKATAITLNKSEVKKSSDYNNQLVKNIVNEKVADNENNTNKKEPVKKNEVMKFSNNIKWFATASSSLLNDHNINHTPDLALDSKLDTAWVEGAAYDGIGEWILLTTATECEVSSIELVSGYPKSKKIFYLNNRVQEVKVTFSGGGSVVKVLKDGDFGFQKITFNTPILTNSIEIKILGVYKGSKYEDTCISEIKVNALSK